VKRGLCAVLDRVYLAKDHQRPEQREALRTATGDYSYDLSYMFFLICSCHINNNLIQVTWRALARHDMAWQGGKTFSDVVVNRGYCAPCRGV
jgi:hypothetical protein